MRTEKVTVNLSLTELGSIDYLVEKGVYASRSDFIRLAIREMTAKHAKEMEQFIEPAYLEGTAAEIRTLGGVGVIGISQNDIDQMTSAGRKIKIRVIGVLVIPDTVTAEQIEQVVASAEIHGKIIAGAEVKKALQNKR